MKVLIACEFSGIVREAFKKKGHDAWSCDFLPSEIDGQHIQDDVLEHLDDGWDLMIAHPPCTYLSYVGMSHWNNPGRAEKRKEAADFFMNLYNVPILRVCVENPRGIMGKWLRPPDQVIHPYYFGGDALKRTCLWLRGLPPLFRPFVKDQPSPVYVDKSGKKRFHTDAQSGLNQKKNRSRFFPSVADAMAEQWGEEVVL